MPAPKGHPLWGNPLNPKKFKTPEELWEKAIEFFEWCNVNPWMKKEAIKSGDKAGELIDIPIQKPYTIEGFCIFANMTFQSFSNYSNGIGYETFFEVAARIREIVRTQKFEGATVGAYNANIIARDLGLIDKRSHEIEDKRKTIDELFPEDGELIDGPQDK